MVSSEIGGIRSAAPYLRNQNDFAARLQLDLISVLKDLPVDRDRHAFLDLGSKAWVFFVQLTNELPESGRFQFELGLATSILMARPARGNDNFTQLNSLSGRIQRRANFRR